MAFKAGREGRTVAPQSERLPCSPWQSLMLRIKARDRLVRVVNFDDGLGEEGISEDTGESLPENGGDGFPLAAQQARDQRLRIGSRSLADRAQASSGSSLGKTLARVLLPINGKFSPWYGLGPRRRASGQANLQPAAVKLLFTGQ